MDLITKKQYHREYKKKWRKENKEKIKIDGIKYRRENKEKIKKYHKDYYLKNKKRLVKLSKIKYHKNKKKTLKFCRLYRKNNREKIRKSQKKHYQRNRKKIMKMHAKYRKKRRAIDKSFAISLRLRSNILQALKKYTRTGKHQSSKKYGIDYKKIIEHLKPFPKNLSKYHIDHIKPLCKFDLTDLKEIKKAFSPRNHQWLLAKENQQKSGKY